MPISFEEFKEMVSLVISESFFSEQKLQEIYTGVDEKTQENLLEELFNVVRSAHAALVKEILTYYAQ